MLKSIRNLAKMKCQQRLCQRTKNICPSGNCHVCEDAVNAIKEKEALKKKVKDKHFEKVALDMKTMVDTHKKLVKGEPVEQKALSELLLGGIINILSQSETVDNILERIEAIEQEKLTNQLRIEALENWVIKLDHQIKEVSEKIEKHQENSEECNANSILVEKIASLESNVNSLFSKENEQAPKIYEAGNESINCKECDAKFSKNCDFEKHMVNEHQQEKEFTCDDCGKRFYLSWRLKKHVEMHKKESKACHYFNNNKVCPYNEIGCMFEHKKLGLCGRKTCTRNLCPFQHSDTSEEEIMNVVEETDIDRNERDSIDDKVETEVKAKEDQQKQNEVENSFCYFCDITFGTQGEFITHMGDEHLNLFPHIEQNEALITF